MKVAFCIFFLLAFPAKADIRDDIIGLVRDHSGQERSAIVVDDKLSKAAQAKADDMILRDYYSHVDPDGGGANRLVESYGYVLPFDYKQSKDANNIESIAKSYKAPNAEYVVGVWLNSPSHRKHLLGEGPVYQEQTHVGVGVSTSEGVTTYVFFSAPQSFSEISHWEQQYRLGKYWLNYFFYAGYPKTGVAYYHYFTGLGDYFPP